MRSVYYDQHACLLWEVESYSIFNVWIGISSSGAPLFDVASDEEGARSTGCS